MPIVLLDRQQCASFTERRASWLGRLIHSDFGDARFVLLPIIIEQIQGVLMNRIFNSFSYSNVGRLRPREKQPFASNIGFLFALDGVDLKVVVIVGPGRGRVFRVIGLFTIISIFDSSVGIRSLRAAFKYLLLLALEKSSGFPLMGTRCSERAAGADQQSRYCGDPVSLHTIPPKGKSDCGPNSTMALGLERACTGSVNVES
jgi:hypothetical protein